MNQLRRRNLFILLSGLAIFLLLAFPAPCFVSAATNANVSISPANQTVTSGETFTVSIAVEPNQDIAGLQFDMTFDPSLVSFSSVDEGNLLSQNGADTYFHPGEIDNEAGTITGVFGVTIGTGETVSTTGTFATITLTANTTGGTCPLTFSNVVVGDSEGNSVPVSVANGTVTVICPPVLDNIGNKVANEGELLTFTISATDPDSETLTYLASNLPDGASFNTSTQTFSWTPDYHQAGTHHSIHFEVSDGTLTDYEDIAITVDNVYQVDINSDESVNVLDIIIVVQYWGEEGPNGWRTEDINEDGTISILDVILIGQHWTE